MRKFKNSVLGGTFDHLHAGHEKLLLSAFDKSAHITIGIVENVFKEDKTFLNNLESFALRKERLASFLVSHKLTSRSQIIPINDIFGTTLIDNSFEAIFVTEETQNNAVLINLERAKLNLQPLSLELVPYVVGDDGQVVSSRRIREGTIDRQGNSYLKLLSSKSIYHLPDSLRPKLQSPIGPAVTSLAKLAELIPPNSLVITVGDIVSRKLLESHFQPAICIIDHRSRRSDIKDYAFPPPQYQLDNPAGTINPQVGSIFLSALAASIQHRPQIIGVSGEEDLLALPTILLAPLGSYVIYGQYGLGMIVVEVTENTKSIVQNLLKQF